ncbi:hypothetical protein Golax_020509 [Gossypium laxum]|uniref:Uncharacterized protein n=1 Tax=Gossypium laxum TaxID=34288 RepID=A0A7J9AYF0_9ROSI|nr:hypothetical protein [Gossypium laxum]
MDMLPILPPTLRRPPSRPTKMRRRESDEPQTTTKLTKEGVEMKCNKCNKLGHNKKSYKGNSTKTFRSQDTKLVFITKWLPQLIKKLPQLTNKLP